jgi:hypothetical protein
MKRRTHGKPALSEWCRNNALFRFSFINAAMASRLKAGRKLVAVRLGLHRNDATLLCNPEVDTLAKATAMSSRYVYECLGELRKDRWITWLEKPGRVNCYQLLPDNVPGATLNPSSGVWWVAHRDSGTVAQSSLNSGAVTSELQTQDPCSGVQTNLNQNHKDNINANLGEEGSVAASATRDALARPPRAVSATIQEEWLGMQREFSELQHVQFDRIMRDGTVWLSVETPANAVSIQEIFRAVLLDRWRKLRPGAITDIKVMTLGTEEDRTKVAAPRRLSAIG